MTSSETLAVVATSTSLPLVCVATGLWSVCTGYVSSLLVAILLTSTRLDVLGRVQSVVSMLANAVTPVATSWPKRSGARSAVRMPLRSRFTAMS